MKLRGCSREIMEILREGPATCIELRDKIGKYNIRSVNNTLHRLESFGFINEPTERNGGKWKITKAGLSNINGDSVDEDMGMCDDRQDIDCDTQEVNNSGVDDDSIVEKEIELSLAKVKAQLSIIPISARCRKVYHELLSSLPEILREELKPITTIVESMNV